MKFLIEFMFRSCCNVWSVKGYCRRRGLMRFSRGRRSCGFCRRSCFRLNVVLRKYSWSMLSCKSSCIGLI